MKGSSKTIDTSATVRLLVALAAAGLALSACAAGPGPSARLGGRLEAPSAKGQGSGAAERALGRYKLGAPYEVGGMWYVPADQPGYDEVGVASWYGEPFDGRPTANGELFDMRAATAAHATLPMPSILEVTNLENGRTVRVRMNDRGPFKAGRLIDLSRGAAEELGFAQQGTAKVRVRYIGPARLDHPNEPLMAAARSEPEPRRASGSPAPVPAAAPQAGGDAFAVQAGAFSDRGRAEQVAARLSAAGTASIRPVDLSGGRLYRVVVGGYPDAAAAEAARVRVAALGFADARIVKAF